MNTVTPGLNPYAGPWDQDAVRHLLRRTMFGAKRSTISTFLSIGLNSSIDSLLDDTFPLPLPPLKEYNPSAYKVDFDGEYLPAGIYYVRLQNMVYQKVKTALKV